MAAKSYVRIKTFKCSENNKTENYLEQDVFLMPGIKPSNKRTRRKVSLSDMDPRQLQASAQHKAKQNDLNDNRSRRYCRLFAECNFGNGDILIHLTYCDTCLPATLDEAQKEMDKYIRRLRRIAKARCKKLKYIYVTEEGKRTGRLHHHGIINADSGLTREEIIACWGNGFCSAEINNNTARAVNYFTKSRRLQKGKKLYKASRNLVKPAVTVADTKISMRKLKELTLQNPVEVATFFEKMNPGFTVESVYRYVPPLNTNQTEIDEEQAKLWRDGFSYIRVCMRRQIYRNVKMSTPNNNKIPDQAENEYTTVL